MIFAGSVVTAEGAACLNLLTVKRSVIEDKPAPSGGFQDRQLLISQTARPLSEKKGYAAFGIAVLPARTESSALWTHLAKSIWLVGRMLLRSSTDSMLSKNTG